MFVFSREPKIQSNINVIVMSSNIGRVKIYFLLKEVDFLRNFQEKAQKRTFVLEMVSNFMLACPRNVAN